MVNVIFFSFIVEQRATSFSNCHILPQKHIPFFFPHLAEKLLSKEIQRTLLSNLLRYLKNIFLLCLGSIPESILPYIQAAAYLWWLGTALALALFVKVKEKSWRWSSRVYLLEEPSRTLHNRLHMFKLAVVAVTPALIFPRSMGYIK